MNDGCSQITLSKEFNISAAAITKTINRLAKEKLIIKKADKANKRANLIFITEKGKNALEKAEVYFKMLANFKDEEIIELKRLLDKVLMNLYETNDANEENICIKMKNLFKMEAK